MAEIDADGDRVGYWDDRLEPRLDTEYEISVVLLTSIDTNAGLEICKQGQSIKYQGAKPVLAGSHPPAG